MAEPLKNIFFTKKSIDFLAETVMKYFPEFNKEEFVKMIFDSNWKSKELIERMHHTAYCLHQHLPASYTEALDILKKVVLSIQGFDAMALPDFVAQYGLENMELSLDALEYFARHTSSELAIRPFLAKSPDKVFKFMNKWVKDEHPMVRRLASEGCRPRLPWAMELPKFRKDPSAIIPILEQLKNDESPDVRRSVANNLNDISKDNPEIALDVCEKWFGKSSNTNEIVKHACRGLLKAGNKRAMLIFGFGDPKNILVENLVFNSNSLYIGETLHFSFGLIVDEDQDSKIRLEYCVYYVKAKDKLSKKIFQITESVYSPGLHTIKRKHSFEDMSTRKHKEGMHYLSIIVNGEEKRKLHIHLKSKEK